MTNLPDFNKLFADAQKSFKFDAKAVEKNLETAATFGKRFSAVALEAAAKSNDIASKSAHESIANLRGVAVYRDEPAAYGKAIADFFQSQVDLVTRAAENFGVVAQAAQTKTTDLVTEAGELVKKTTSANVNAAAKKAA